MNQKRKRLSNGQVQNQYGADGHIYYNITIPNDTDAPILANFAENRQAPILWNPSQYHLSVIRFDVPAQLIPIFHWPTLPNSTTPDNTQQWVIVSSGTTGDDYKAYLQYTGYQLSPDGYPAIYSYQEYTDSLNTALQSAVAAMNLAETTTFKPPFFLYNGDTTAPVSLLAGTAMGNNWVSSTGGNPTLKLSYSVYKLFFNFEGVAGDIALGNNTEFTPVIKYNGNNLRTAAVPAGQIVPITYPTIQSTAGTPYDGLEMKTEFNSLFLWNAVRSIQFLSSVGVRSESIPNSSSASTANNAITVLTDFEPSFTDGTQGRSYYQYIPTAEFRRLDLMSNQPMTYFDFQVQWTDNSGHVYPLYIPPGSMLTCKILFEMKSTASRELSNRNDD